MLKVVNALGGDALLDILLLSKDATTIYTGEELEIQLVNDAMLTLWGKDRTVRNMRFEDVIPEMKGQPFTDLLKNVWRTGETYTARDKEEISKKTLNRIKFTFMMNICFVEICSSDFYNIVFDLSLQW